MVEIIDVEEGGVGEDAEEVIGEGGFAGGGDAGQGED